MLRDLLSTIRLIAAFTFIFAGVWLIARWVATQLAMGVGPGSIAAFCVAWSALYPLARRNTPIPRWAHWARGGLVLALLWLFALLGR